jgi:hypothetical protein
VPWANSTSTSTMESSSIARITPGIGPGLELIRDQVNTVCDFHAL